MIRILPARSVTPVVVVLGLACAACDGRLAYRHDDDLEQKVPAEGVQEVRIDVHEGALTVIAGDSETIAIHSKVRRASDTEEGLAALMKMDLEFVVTRPEPGVVRIATPELPAGYAPPAHRAIYRTVVEVPAAVRVEGRTGFGHMAGERLAGAVILATGHGDLRLDSCTGGAEVSTGGGAIIVQKHRGDLVVKNGGKGDTMQVFVDELGAAGVRLETEVGGVQLHVPSSAGFAMDVTTMEGRASNSFGVPVESSPDHPNGKVMRGEVAGGGPPVVIRAMKGGNVSVRARSSD